MRILFGKISAMKFYKGVIPGKDEAFNGAALLRSMGKEMSSIILLQLFQKMDKHIV